MHGIDWSQDDIVYMPHGGYDEENCITGLSLIKVTMEEGSNWGAKNMFIGGDRNIDLRLEGG